MRLAPHPLVCLLATAFTACASQGAQPTDPTATALESFLDGTLPAAELAITYSDLHQLHGGLELTIRGDGKVEQQALREEVGEPRDLSGTEVAELARLLLELEAWRQLEPERMPVPDESRASLRISAGDAESEIWEWFNDLADNQRLIRIRDKMQQLAWE